MTAPPLLQILWRRNGWFFGGLGVCLLAGLIYALAATRIYQSTALLLFSRSGSKVLNDGPDPAPLSDAFMYSQAGAITSTPVLQRAVDKLNPSSMRTFDSIPAKPVDWLRTGDALHVDVGKKDQIVSVTMESAYPREAAAIAGSIVDAFLQKLEEARRNSSDNTLKLLQGELNSLAQQAQEYRRQMYRFEAEAGTASFKDDHANVPLERLTALSTSLTTADLAVVDLKSQLSAAKEVLATPESISAYVEAQETKSHDFGDKEFDDIRSSLQQLNLVLTGDLSIQGSGNTRVRVIRAEIDQLRQRLADKERAIAESHLRDVEIQLHAAEQKQQELHSQLEARLKQQGLLHPQAAEYSRLSAALEQNQKQQDALQARLEQVSLQSKADGDFSVEVLDPAQVPDRPEKPRKSFIMAAALLLGVMLGAGGAFAAEWRDHRVRRPEEIMPILDVSVVGLIPRISGISSLAMRGRLCDEEDPADAADAFRSLRATLQFGAARDAKTLLVTSPAPGDGKSTTASNLAIVLAQAGMRTLLIDCDLRKPTQTRIFESDARRGLTNVLEGQSRLRDVIKPTGVDQLFLLPCGSIPTNPTELLSGRRFSEVMQSLCGSFDRIVIDSPPVSSFADARILASSADATLLVLRMNQSLRELSVVSVEALHKVGANVLGVVANDIPPAEENGYYAVWKRYAPQRRRRPGLLEGTPRITSSRQKSEKRRQKQLAAVPAIEEPRWVNQSD